MSSWRRKASALVGFEEPFFLISLRMGKQDGNLRRIEMRSSNGVEGDWKNGTVHHSSEARTDSSSAVNDIVNWIY